MTSLVLSSLSRRATMACGSSSRLMMASAASTTRHTALRTFVSRSLPLSEDLPYHIVMGMPALSPTMESGTLAEWYVKEGDSFIAGDSLAKIETDKATMDFEAQDDGYCAKLLVEAGGGNDIPVGKPIMVTVEEEEDVAAFANYTPPEAQEAAPAAEEKEEAPKAAEPSPPPPPPKEEAPAKAAAESSPPPPPPKQEASPPPPPPPSSSTQSAAPPTSGWGSLAFINSPIAKTLSKKQKAYIEKYGTTGQAPL